MVVTTAPVAGTCLDTMIDGVGSRSKQSTAVHDVRGSCGGGVADAVVGSSSAAAKMKSWTRTEISPVRPNT